MKQKLQIDEETFNNDIKNMKRIIHKIDIAYNSKGNVCMYNFVEDDNLTHAKNYHRA